MSRTNAPARRPTGRSQVSTGAGSAMTAAQAWVAPDVAETPMSTLALPSTPSAPAAAAQGLATSAAPSPGAPSTAERDP